MKLTVNSAPAMVVFFALLFLLSFPPTSTQAQSTSPTDTCPVIVEDALDQLDLVCTQLGRNEACYGHSAIEAEAQADIASLQFDVPGDIESVVGIRALTLSDLDPDTDSWGIAMMRLQANLPETLPGQNVLFVMFGDVQVEASELAREVPRITATVNSSGNVRSGPSTNQGIVTSLNAGTDVVADGRNDAGDWLRIRTPDDRTGWIASFLLNLDGDASALEVVAAGDVSYNPFQAFYFTTSPSIAQCREAPDSGILIQTPPDAPAVNLVINDVEILLGSTAYLQSQPSGEMTIDVLEGSAGVTVAGRSVTAPAGLRVRIPVDENSSASGAPELDLYDLEALSSLPIRALDESITIAEPYNRPVILNLPFYVHTQQRVVVPLEFYNPSGSRIVSQFRQFISSNPSRTGWFTGSVTNIRLMSGNFTRGALEFVSTCNLTTQITAVYSVSITNAEGQTSEPYIFTFQCPG